MSQQAARRLLKELAALQIEDRTDPGNLRIRPISEDNIFHWYGEISNIAGPYEGGLWKIDIQVPENYPLRPPSISFKTPICHPNVNFKTGEICLDILKNQWTAVWTLQSTCMAIIALLNDPAIESPLNVDAANVLRSGDTDAYNSLVRYYTVKYAISK
ncbi:ubiquitin-conjugating enzyme/RWD-like protein [Dipodascopsis uninucleata]